MNETDLRRMLSEAADRVPPRTNVPLSLLRRARTRKATSVLASILVLGLAVSGAFAGRSLLRPDVTAASACDTPFQQITARPAELRENAVAHSGRTTYLASGNGFVVLEAGSIVFSAVLTPPGGTARIYDIVAFGAEDALAVGEINRNPSAQPGTVETIASVWRLRRDGFSHEYQTPGLLLDVTAAGNDAWASGRSRAGALLLHRPAGGTWAQVDRPRDIFSIEGIAAASRGRLIVLTPVQSSTWVHSGVGVGRRRPLWLLDGRTWKSLPPIDGTIMGMASSAKATWLLLADPAVTRSDSFGTSGPMRFPNPTHAARLDGSRWTMIALPVALTATSINATDEGAWIAGSFGEERKPYLGIVKKSSVVEVALNVDQSRGDVFDIEASGRSIIVAGSNRFVRNRMLFVALRVCPPR